jgi:hypothetical protein
MRALASQKVGVDLYACTVGLCISRVVLCPQEAVLSLSPEETIQMMSAGRRFTRCLEDGSSSPVGVFYVAGDGRSGTLYWTLPGAVTDRTTSEERALPLHKVSDILLGKQSKALKHPKLANLTDHTCFSLYSSQVYSLSLSLTLCLSLQARSGTTTALLSMIRGVDSMAQPLRKVTRC